MLEEAKKPPLKALDRVSPPSSVPDACAHYHYSDSAWPYIAFGYKAALDPATNPWDSRSPFYK